MNRFTSVATHVARALDIPVPTCDRPAEVLGNMGYLVNHGDAFDDYHGAAILAAGNLAHKQGIKGISRKRIAGAAGSLAARRVGGDKDTEEATRHYVSITQRMTTDEILVAGQLADKIIPHLVAAVSEYESRPL